MSLFDAANTTPAFMFEKSEIRRLTTCEDSLCTEVAETVRRWFAEMVTEWRLYRTGEIIVLRDSDIAYTCAMLSSVLVSDKTRDVFGDALEIFRGQWAKRESGQFFTDPQVTSLAITLIDFNPLDGDDLVDICAGTAGFLLAGLNRIHEVLEALGESSEGVLVNLASSCLRGQEVDEGVAEIANATLNSRISNLQIPIVQTGDSLDPQAFSTSSDAPIRFGVHRCAATNPPFGTKITIKDEKSLREFALASRKGGSSARSPDILFLEQNVKLLVPGVGRLAIVVPYQILSGPQTFFVREWLLRNTELIAVVDLPVNTFQPHTGTKASLLVVRRRLQPLTDPLEATDYDIFMSTPRWIGHDRRGKPAYRVSEDGSVTDEILTDIPDVKSAFQHFKKGGKPETIHPQSFATRLSSIIADPNLRLNALFHKPSLRDTDRVGFDSSWRFVRLSDVVDRIFYPTRFKRHYVDRYPGAVPFLGGTNISQLVVDTDKWLRHDNPKLSELEVKTGWLLVTRSGTTGIVSVVPQAWDGFALSEHIIRIIPNPDKMDPDYLYAFLRSKYAQNIIAKGVFGSVIDEITPEYIGEMLVPVPISGSVFQKITGKIRQAENHRAQAIENLVEAVDELDEMLRAV